VEAYQVYKARASGADAILLIAAVLPNQDLAYLMKAAGSLGMRCLIEVRRLAWGLLGAWRSRRAGSLAHAWRFGASPPTTTTTQPIPHRTATRRTATRRTATQRDAP
jgi:hypothetical protein